MDIFAHFLWTFGIYWKHPKRWLAGFLGFVPDLLSFSLFFIYRIFHGGVFVDVTTISIPHYVYVAYSVTHSMLICAVGMTLLWFAAREWFWLSFGWPLHILIDIPTHTNAFFPTPMLWPLSDFHVGGVSWAAPWFMAANYTLLVLIYTYLVMSVPRSA